MKENSFSNRLILTVKFGWKQLQDPYYQGFAAQLSFYFMMSLIPIMMVISQVLAVVFKEDLRLLIAKVLLATGTDSLPGGMERFLIGGGSGTISIIFIVIALWSASKAQFSLIRIANYTLTGGITTGEGFVKDRLRAYITMVITILGLVVAIGIIIYGEVATSIIFEFFNAESKGAIVWVYLRWPLAVALYFSTISLLYYVLPTNRLKLRDIIPGSLFASAGLLLVTFFYSIYANSLATYNVLYGSLATIIAMMIWFYLIGWVLTLGLILIYALVKSKEEVEEY